MKVQLRYIAYDLYCVKCILMWKTCVLLVHRYNVICSHARIHLPNFIYDIIAHVCFKMFLFLFPFICPTLMFFFLTQTLYNSHLPHFELAIHASAFSQIWSLFLMLSIPQPPKLWNSLPFEHSISFVHFHSIVSLSQNIHTCISLPLYTCFQNFTSPSQY